MTTVCRQSSVSLKTLKMGILKAGRPKEQPSVSSRSPKRPKVTIKVTKKPSGKDGLIHITFGKEGIQVKVTLIKAN